MVGDFFILHIHILNNIIIHTHTKVLLPILVSICQPFGNHKVTPNHLLAQPTKLQLGHAILSWSWAVYLQYNSLVHVWHTDAARQYKKCLMLPLHYKQIKTAGFFILKKSQSRKRPFANFSRSLVLGNFAKYWTLRSVIYIEWCSRQHKTPFARHCWQ